MNRIITTFLSSCTFVLLACVAACDPQTDDPAAHEQIAIDELELLTEQQLEEHDGADLVCNEWPEADWVPEGPIAEHDIEPCLEWTDEAGQLSVASPEEQVPTGACNVWQEQKWIETNVNCGGWGGGPCSGNYCCTLGLKYVRTCSACPPNVPTSCDGWTFVGSFCGCG
jgi:hypothetical protein